MAATIKTKIRTTTGGTASTTAGELCVNTFDKKIFIGDGAATVELANQIGYNTITTLGTISTGTWSATAIGATKGGTGQTTYATGDLIYSSAADTLSKLTKPGATSVLSMTSGGVPSWNGITGTGNTVFGTSPSISTLEISTTGGADKTAAINMATGVTATNSVLSQITLNAYNADSLGAPPVPFTKTSYIRCTDGYDLQLGTGYDSYIAFESNIISLGDVAGANGGGVITIDTPDAGYISLTATNIVIATTTPVEGKVLTCLDGSGTASWETLTFSEPTSSPSISTGTLVLDLSVSRVFTVSFNASVTTLTISNTPATASMSQNFTLILTADGTARTITWPASVKWANNDPPALTSANAKKDILSFVSTDAGTTWYGFIGGLNF